MPPLFESLFYISGICIVASFAAGPSILLCTYLIRGKKPIRLTDTIPRISIIIVGRNAEEMAAKKIQNTLALDYPEDKREVIFYSDGSTDETLGIARAFEEKNIHVYSSKSHCGKFHGINEAVKVCSGEILVFTDLDVMLEPGSVKKLVPYFGDPAIGGVSGCKVIIKDNAKLDDAQNIYTQWAGAIKWMENTLGCITTNDGTLYAIRKELFREIPPAVTDDLYICLAIIRQRHRFLYNSEALAFMTAPSKDVSHELRRRRRIVSTSLRGIYLSREIFNPFKYGAVGLSLFFNKVLRRLIPLFMITLFLSNIPLAFSYPLAQGMLLLQCAFYLLAMTYGISVHHSPKNPKLTKALSFVFYFCLGNYGTFLGLIDLAMGKQITKW